MRERLANGPDLETSTFAPFYPGGRRHDRGIPLDPRGGAFQTWETLDLADATQLVSDQATVVPDTPGTWLQLALVLTTSSSVIGDCGIHFIRENIRQVELGITLAPTYQRQGLATRGHECRSRICVRPIGQTSRTALTDAKNHASALFRRLGFRQEAHYIDNVWFKGAWGSEYFFAMLRRMGCTADQPAAVIAG